MGNGCGAVMGKSTGSSLPWVRVAGAVFVLLLAACVMLGSGSSHYAQKSLAQGSSYGFPIPSAFGKTPSKAKDARALLSQLPLIFEPNQGQADSSVKFVARGSGYSLYLDPAGAVLAMQTARPALAGQRGPDQSKPSRSVESVRMTLVGANAAAVAGSDLLPGKSNYFIGNDPKKWHTGIPQFAGVHYQSVYPGIDLVFYGSQGHLEYDFKVAPGADPSQAELQFDGASKLELSGGDLILKGTEADVRLQAPRVYQRAGAQQQTVEGHFVLRAANRVGFKVGAYDHSRELVIDPTIQYSTYFGGVNGTESSPSIAVNGNTEIYLAGSTTSNDLPIPTGATPYQGTLKGAQNIFVLELDPTQGTAGVLALTYLGGSGTDTSVGLAVDSAGNAYVAGTTTSSNFPTANGYTSPTASAGMAHVFVSVLNPTFTALNYSTYLAGNGTDIASGMTIDNNQDVFVTGTTTSTNNPVNPQAFFPASPEPVPFQQSQSPGSTIQFFVTEVNTKTSGVASVPYSTYFGGNNGTTAAQQGGGIAVDTTGNVYFSGTTSFFNSGEGTNGVGGQQAGDFPILNAYQPCLDTPPPTILTFPVSCTAPASPAATDAFVAKLNPANAQTGGAQLLFSTYLGGTGTDSSTGMTIDTGAASIYITGTTNSPDFVVPTGTAAFQECLDTPVNPAVGTACPTITAPAPTDAYVGKFTNPTESSGTTSSSIVLSYFSYLGGTGNDSGLAIAVDTAGGALVTGATSSGTIGVVNAATDFPVTAGAIQSVLNGPQNAFFAHIDTTTISGQSGQGSYATYFGGNGVDRGTSITVDTALNTYFAGDTTSSNLEVKGAFQPALNGTMDAFAVKLQPASDLCIRCVAPILSPASGVVSAGNQITVTFTVINDGPDLATNVIVSGQLSTGLTATFNTATAGSGTCSVPSGNNVVCTIPTLQSGSTSTVAFAVTPTAAGGGSVTATVTYANNTNSTSSASASFTSTAYSVSISPSSQTVVAGNTAIYSVEVTPSVTFAANVALTCGSTPVGASCGFSPSSLTFNGPGAQSATLNLTTTARPITTISSTGWRSPIYAVWLMAPGMALLGIGGNKRRRNRLLAFLALSTLFALIVLQPACSKTKQQPVVSGTPAGSYPLTVTATSGSFAPSASFSLTVQ